MSPRHRSSQDFFYILYVKTGGVSIELIYWQLKTSCTTPPLPVFLPPLRAGQGNGSTETGAPSLLLSPLSSCLGIFVGFYHHFFNNFPQQRWEAAVAGWVLAHSGSRREPAATGCGQHRAGPTPSHRGGLHAAPPGQNPVKHNPRSFNLQ